MVVGMEALGATGGASKARMPEMNAQRLCKDAKPAKHTQTLTLRKVGGIMQIRSHTSTHRPSPDEKREG